MTTVAPRSLRWLLVRRLVLLQTAMLTTVVLAAVAVLWATGHLISLEPDDETVDALRDAIARDAGGNIVIRDTEALTERLREAPDLWYIVRDRNGRHISHGAIPAPFSHFGTALDDIGQARFGWTLGDPPRPTARMRSVDTPDGRFQILTGSAGPVPWPRLLRAIGLLVSGALLPVIIIMTLTTLIATPLVVRRALGGLARVATHAQRIEIDRRGARLPEDGVSSEVVPLVKAVNDALQRIDDGYARHQRFLVDAAHELRTPIAVLQTRIESLPAGPDMNRLLQDTRRLSTLADQLLDIERLKHAPAMTTSIDLVALARDVTADLAPLVIASGYEIAFDSNLINCCVTGDGSALERALTNLIQNAIEYGGRRGQILVRVDAPATMSVVDQGLGIAPDQQERVFEPFYRGPDSTTTRSIRGAGLGLNLVREIMRLHDGRVEIRNDPSGGARVTMTFRR